MNKSALDIFKSKRFWSAVVGLIFMILTSVVPELKEQADVLIPAVLTIVGILIGGYSLQDTATALRNTSTQYPPTEERTQ